jgi:hypothetical protein
MPRRQRGVLLLIDFQPTAEESCHFRGARVYPEPTERSQRQSGHNARNEPGRLPVRRGCVVLVAGALVAVGCGGKSNSATTQTTATAASTPTTGATATAGLAKDCNTLGINPTGMREGTCTHAGITYVIVNRNHILRLPTLRASLDSVNAVDALSGTKPTTGQTKFVIASITITNHLSLPQSIDKSGTQQAGLILDGTVYKESAGVEKSSDPSSCQISTPKISPGSSATCDVVFQVPAASASDLGTHGRADLYVVDFGSDLAGNPPPQTVGEIRLYR